MRKGKPQSIRDAFVSRAAASSIEEGLAELIPSAPAIAEIVMRVFNGPTISRRIDDTRSSVGLALREFEDISIDATVNIVQNVLGAVPEGKTGKREPDQDRRCTTVKGRAGVVLAIGLSQSEGFDQQLDALMKAVPPRFRGDIRSICSDYPVVLLSGKERLRRVFPGLESLSEGPVHGKIRLEKCSGEKSNQVSSLVHDISVRFFHEPHPPSPGEVYRWAQEEIDADSAAALASFDATLAGVSLDDAMAALGAVGRHPLYPCGIW